MKTVKAIETIKAIGFTLNDDMLVKDGTNLFFAVEEDSIYACNRASSVSIPLDAVTNIEMDTVLERVLIHTLHGFAFLKM